MEDWHSLLEVLAQTTERAVLATILRVKGSAYRKAGAAMLMLADGRQVGMLSAGCLEADLAARAEELFARGDAFAEGHGGLASCLVRYDLRAEDDLTFGQGPGCNGALEVLLEPIDERMRTHWQAVKASLDRGVPVWVVRRVTQEGQVNGSKFLAAEKSFGERAEEVPVTWQELGGAEQSFRQQDGVRPLTVGKGEHSLWAQLIRPRPRLILFGAGPDVRPLVSMATQTGFAVTVADWRPAYCHPAHFPQAEELVLGSPESSVAQLQLTANDAVVVMTHHFQRDRQLLHLLLQQELLFLGILGPRRRTERLLEERDIPAWLHAPVGLAIGAQGPTEIAISILAELIQQRRHPTMTNS